MGYTHYWSQTKDFGAEEWAEVCEDIGILLKEAQHLQSIPLANGMGDPMTAPEFLPERIIFNGVGAKAHETFSIEQTQDSNCCKTDRKPYDLAVCACLVYLATVRESHFVTSDGKGQNWLAAVEFARQALPRYANTLDIPMPIMQNDRWTPPVIYSSDACGFRIRFCIDGHAYVFRNADQAIHAFETHYDLACWLNATKSPPDRMKPRSSSLWSKTPETEPNIWNATGSFDEKRHKFLTKLQKRACTELFAQPQVSNALPPAYVRPGEFPEIENQTYDFRDLLNASI